MDPDPDIVRDLLPTPAHVLELLGEPVDDSYVRIFTSTYGADWLSLLVDGDRCATQFSSIWTHVHSRPDWELLEVLACEHWISELPAAIAAQLASHMSFDKTLHVIRGSVALALYSRAKSVGWREPITFVRALGLAERYLAATVENPALSRTESRAAFDGRLGVARVLQSRYLDLDASILSAAIKNLEDSIAGGNTSPDAYAYLCEARLRCFDQTHDPAQLQRIIFARNSLPNSERATSLEATAAEAWLRLSDIARSSRREFANRALAISLELANVTDPLVVVHAKILEALALARVDRTSPLPVLGLRLPFGLKRQLRQWAQLDPRASCDIAQAVINGIAASPMRVRRDPLTRRIEASARSALGELLPGDRNRLREQWIESAVEKRSASKTQSRLTDPESTLENVLDLFALYRSSGKESALVSAIEAALILSDFDQAWPTPLVVLARELESVMGPMSAPASYRLAQLKLSTPSLLAAVQRLDSKHLYKLAASRALASREVDRRHLGGRTGVYLAEDYSGVVSDTFVFKPTTGALARREDERTQLIRSEIVKRSLETRFQLAETLASDAIPERDSLRARGYDVIVARQYHDGEILAHYLNKADHSTAFRMMQQAVEYLGLIHAVECHGPDRGRAMRPQIWKKEFGRWLKSLKIANAEGVFAEWWEVANSVAAPFARRDAHAFNWIVTPGQTLVALDLEGCGWRPAGYELAQLIDDQPFLSPDSDGWTTRMRLLERYFVTLRKFGEIVDRRSLVDAYSAGIVARATGLLTSPTPRTGTRDHGLGLLRMVGAHAGNPSAKNVANKIAAAWLVRLGTSIPTGEIPEAMTPARRRHISRAMAYELRHGTTVRLTSQGWGLIADLSVALRQSGVHATIEEIRVVANAIDEKRFELSENSIRAMYGHTREVDISYEKTPSSALLFHGTAISNLNAIFVAAQGLRPMGRLWVHLSSDPQAALRTARRHGPGVLLSVDPTRVPGGVHQAGGHVYLADSVPPEALRVVTLAELFVQGIEPLE